MAAPRTWKLLSRLSALPDAAILAQCFMTQCEAFRVVRPHEMRDNAKCG
jgi:hypothetical protein